MEEGNNRRQEIAVGIFVLLAITGLVYLSFRLGGGKPAQAKTYELLFDSALGLQRDNMVTVAGVRVGVVEDIRIDGKKARVRIAVQPSLKVFADASAALRARTLLGEKYIDLMTGTPGTERLKNGATLAHTEPTVEIDALIRGAQEIIVRVNTILPTLQTAVEKIDGFVRQSDVDSTMRSLSDVFNEMTTLLGTLTNLSKTSGEDFSTLLASLRQSTPALIERLDNTLSRIDKLAAAVPADSMAKAINAAPRAVNNADKALVDLRVALADMRDVSEKGAKISTTLQRLLNRLDAIDEKAIREFMQVQGFRVNLTANPTSMRRIRELQNHDTSKPAEK